MIDPPKLLGRSVLIGVLAIASSAPAAIAQSHEPDPEARKAFAQVVEAYRKRPGLAIKTTVSIELAKGEFNSKRPEVKAEFILGKGRQGKRIGVIKLRGFTCYLGQGKLAAIHESTDDAYYSTPDDDSPYYALMNAFVQIPFPHLAIAFGDEDLDALCMEFHQMAPWVQPTGVKSVTVDGRTLTSIRMTSDFDDMAILVDPKTQLIESIKLVITGGALVEPGATLTYRHTFSYETPREPRDESIFAFDPGDRQAADMLLALVARTPAMTEAPRANDLIGQPAPAFVLPTADGGEVDLQRLRGRVVVLDFWATWCAPCRQGLPLLHDVADWVSASELPVEILTINIWEHGQGEARLEKATKFWQDKGFSLPILMDYEGETAAPYGLSGIPVTVVIRADGVVHAHHFGLLPDYVESLKREINGALDAGE